MEGLEGGVDGCKFFCGVLPDGGVSFLDAKVRGGQDAWTGVFGLFEGSRWRRLRWSWEAPKRQVVCDSVMMPNGLGQGSNWCRLDLE